MSRRRTMSLPRRLVVVAVAALASLGTVVAIAAPSTPAAPALDPNGPRGLDLVDAFRLTTGAPTSVIAYVEGGINYALPQGRRLADHVYVNWREVPVPCVAATAAACTRRYGTASGDYDSNRDGAVTIADWTHDPRVHDANASGFLDPEDLLAAFRDGIDHDHNGFPNDVSGWDFYDDQPDSATLDAAYTHSDDQMLNALAQCPKCLLMPVKAGEEALDATDKLAQAWLYAAQSNVTVIDSVTADLGYSSYMRQAVDAIAAHGIAMVESSNDFDSTDHQGGMFWPGVVPGNGALADRSGQNWVRANETSWGTHNLFSIAGQGSTSGATSATGGLVGLLMAWGQQEYAAHHLAAPLTGQQAIQVLRQSAAPIHDTSLAWPGAPGDWSLQYGYGIPNLYRAMRAVSANDVPPVAAITSPDWYTLVDPTATTAVPVAGRVDAPAGERWSYQLQLGIGSQPGSFTTVASGTHTGAWSGSLGRVPLSAVPRSFYDAPMQVSQTKELPTAEQYALTLRLVVTDSRQRTGVDRRAVYAHHDGTLVGGFPLRLPASGESQPALADLTGAGREDIVFGTADGQVHAIDPATHAELPGFPVATEPVRVRRSYPGIDPGHEPVIADVAVGDLRHDGHEEVVATSASGRVYAWSAGGGRLPGWPRTLDTSVTPPPIPRPALPFTRLPVVGAVAAPVLADLTGTGRLDVVQAAWDGHLHAYDVQGFELPGWPVRVDLPAGTTTPSGYDVVHDHKLDATPAVAYLDGPHQPPSLVERSQYTETRGAGIQPLGYGFVYAYTAAGRLRSGWPAKLPSVIEYYSSAQEFITEGSSSAVAADVTGTGLGPDEVAVSPVFSVPYLLDGAGRVVGVYGSVAPGLAQLLEPGYLAHLPDGQHLPDSAIAFTTSGAFGKLGGTLRFAQAESGGASLALAELQDNSGRGIEELESVFPAAGGPTTPGFPATRQGLNFLGSPTFADVDGTGLGDVIDGGDSNALHAYTAAGTPVKDFPKFTTGWNVFSPATGDLFATGRTDLVMTTREGYLFAWKTAGRATGNDQWWRWGHDEYNSGRYGTVARPPGAPRALRWSQGQLAATFVAPGSTWYDGTVSAYRVTFAPSGRTVSLPPGGPAGSLQRLVVPAGTRSVRVQAVNGAGLLGLPASAS